MDKETNQLLESVPLELISGVEEDATSTIEMLLDAATEPITEERGRATQAVASHQSANGEKGKEQRHDSGNPCQGLPILTMK